MRDISKKEKYKTPGVYVEETSVRPPSVAQVETAIPAFIGYTETGIKNPVKISSMDEYIAKFGGGSHHFRTIKIDQNGKFSLSDLKPVPDYRLFYSVKMFFANGGEKCWVISTGKYSDTVKNEDMLDGLNLLKPDDEPTLLVFPDVNSPLNKGDYVEVYNEALDHCSNNLRFLICDVKVLKDENDIIGKSATEFRNSTGNTNLHFGAAYFPDLKTTLNYDFAEDDVVIEKNGNKFVLRYSDETIKSAPEKEKESFYHVDDSPRKHTYQSIKNRLSSIRLELPPSGAIAGIYARVDKSSGVWKAPANVSVNRVSSTTVGIDNKEQSTLNVHNSGKSINAIRSFDARGIMVWGARTLAGNDNEWRYVPVRRFFNVVQKSIQKSTGWVVSEPNDTNTWSKAKAQIENYLNRLWHKGALAGNTPDNAYFVKVGLDSTMTNSDVTDGKIIIEVGLAAIRSAEFIIFRVTHQNET